MAKLTFNGKTTIDTRNLINYLKIAEAQRKREANTLVTRYGLDHILVNAVKEEAVEVANLIQALNNLAAVTIENK